MKSGRMAEPRSGMGSAPAPGAVFHALAGNSAAREYSRRLISAPAPGTRLAASVVAAIWTGLAPSGFPAATGGSGLAPGSLPLAPVGAGLAPASSAVAPAGAMAAPGGFPLAPVRSRPAPSGFHLAPAGSELAPGSFPLAPIRPGVAPSPPGAAPGSSEAAGAGGPAGLLGATKAARAVFEGGERWPREVNSRHYLPLAIS